MGFPFSRSPPCVMTDLKYWITSVPAQPSRESVYSSSQQATNGVADTAKFNVPSSLRVGTLDSLMSMSDELVKIDHTIEVTAKKIGHQIYSLKDNKPEKNSIFLTVGGASLSDYIRRFQWDTAKYSVRLSIHDLTQRFQEQVQAIEEEYRTKMTDYSNVAHAVAQYERSLQANLAIRDLSDLVEGVEDDIVDSEFLITLFVVCSRNQEKEWEEVYESFATDPSNSPTDRSGRPNVIEYVVPGSCKRIAQEGDQCLLAVTLLKRFKELFKQEAAKHHVTVREVKIDKEDSRSGREKYQEMKKDMKEKQNKLFQWCQTNFTEVFTAWAHLKALRVHVESILRFGLPPEYVSSVVKPHKISNEKQIRKNLEQYFAQHGSVHMQEIKEDVPGFSTNEKFYPYVYLEMDLNYCKD